MKPFIFHLLFLFSILSNAQELQSPDKNFHLKFLMNKKGEVFYHLIYKNKEIVKDSKLGFLINNNISLSDSFILSDIQYSDYDNVWNPVLGEQKTIRDNHKEMLIHLTQPKTGYKVDIRFRLFNDGLGFRYEFPVQKNLYHFRINDEITEFNLSRDDKAFWMPADYDTNEFSISTSKISEIAAQIDNVRKEPHPSNAPSKTLAVQTPLMLKSDNGLYINIHEAALINYPAMHLNVDDKNFKLSANLSPNRNGEKAFMQTQMKTPWRTIVVSDDARDILASKLILNLNDPSKIDDTSWIKPTKYIGVWWEYFIGSGASWSYTDNQDILIGKTNYSELKPNHHHPANTKHVKEYIDFAAENGFDAVLVEGWNEGWEDWAPYEKEKIFSFTKAYPDFNVEELQAYAKSKGVKIIMHHETTSSIIDYERQLDDAFLFMKKYGYDAVKTGYVGPIIPRSEYHDSQWMVNHYNFVTEKAAKYKILVNSHEAVRPTGLSRTYPNWVAQESARGTEFESVEGNRPDHTTILPFTRLMGGPMDYTPGIFQTDLSVYGKNKNRVCTTLVKQLAYYVTMYSPMQMAADLPDNYRKRQDAFQFIKDVAVDWDDTYILEAEPGDLITIARKAKNKNEWFVGGITDENERIATINFSFLPKGKNYEAIIYEDGEKADWKTSLIDYRISTKKITSKTVLKKRLASSGGIAISIKEIRP